MRQGCSGCEGENWRPPKPSGNNAGHVRTGPNNKGPRSLTGGGVLSQRRRWERRIWQWKKRMLGQSLSRRGVCGVLCVCAGVRSVVVRKREDGGQQVMQVRIPSRLHERDGSICPFPGRKHMGNGQQKGACHRSPGSIPCAFPSAKGKTAWKTSPSRSRRPTGA